ncbi:MAG: S8 family serine peptidase [Planctomycetota bacterium]
MHRHFPLAFASIVCAASAQDAAQVQVPQTPVPQVHVRGFANGDKTAVTLSRDRIVVRFHKATEAAAIDRLAQDLGLDVVDRGRHDEFVVFRTDADLADGWIRWFAAQPGVDYAERDAVAHTATAPNDSFWATYQWNMYNQGALSNGVASNFGIQAEAAWDAGARGAGVVVAVVDSGVAYENFGGWAAAPDLVGRAFVSPYDAVTGDGHPNDENGHGTHVAGTIGQVTNNGTGCAGVARDCTIMPVRVLDASGSGAHSWIANGITWSADHGAQVINMSLGGGSGSTTLSNAVTYAANAGLTICAATGNTGRSGVQYPARYTACIAVGATRFDGRRPRYSTYGSGIDVVAPGGDVTVDQNGDGFGDGVLQQTFDPAAPGTFAYYFFQGTSMATPHVAAVAALVRSVRPGYSAAQVRSAIESSCRDLGRSGYDTTYGNGLVDAATAITR